VPDNELVFGALRAGVRGYRRCRRDRHCRRPGHVPAGRSALARAGVGRPGHRAGIRRQLWCRCGWRRWGQAGRNALTRASTVG